MSSGCSKNIIVLAMSLLSSFTSPLLMLPPSYSISRTRHSNVYSSANSIQRNSHHDYDDVITSLNQSYVLEWKKDNMVDDATSTLFNAALFSSSKSWGRRPFLLRNAFDLNTLLFLDDNDDFSSTNPWPSWQDVVDIASDYDAESRVISHIPGDHSTFDIRWGPLSEEEVNNWLHKETKAEESNYQLDKTRKQTLVVNDIDRFHPPLADWIYDTFNFIPNWRMDDGQISLAEVHGGIGPHVDNYDVFLIQMNGSRKWQIGSRKINAFEEGDRLIEKIDVRILRDWNDNQDAEVEEWILNPGDMLYLPPRVPHCGIALSAGCMTLSVGCRAPSVSDLVSRLAEHLSHSLEENSVRRYTDDDLLDNDSSRDIFLPGEITLNAKEDAKHLVLNALTTMLDDDFVWDEFFGRYVTEPKRVRNNYPIPLDDSTESPGPSVQDVLEDRGVLYHAEGICFSYSVLNFDSSSTIHRLFINGEMWQCDSADESMRSMGQFYETIANHRMLNGTILLKFIGDKQKCCKAVAFLDELVSIGYLYASEK